MKLYLLNALITPFEATENEMAVFIVQKLSQEKFIEIFHLAVDNGLEIISAIGHQSTADFLKQILPDNLKKYISHQRKEIYIEEGEMALIFRVAVRGERIKEFSLEELREFHEKSQTEFLVLSRVYEPETVFEPANIAFQEE